MSVGPPLLNKLRDVVISEAQLSKHLAGVLAVARSRRQIQRLAHGESGRARPQVAAHVRVLGAEQAPVSFDGRLLFL